MYSSEYPELKPFLNEKEQLTQLPAKHKKKLTAIYYLGEKLESGRQYTEGEINDLLDGWTTFHDPATLRREMYNTCLLNRTRDCAAYWKAEDIPPLTEFTVRYT